MSAGTHGLGISSMWAAAGRQSGMMPRMTSPERLPDLTACVARILAHTGGHMRVAAPLGLGKPHGLLNALYRHVAAHPQTSLTIFTALSLTRPQPAPGLEARFLGPFLDRHFGSDYEDLDYTLAQARDALPPNIHVHEFYMQSGALLHSRAAQQDYISQNYTHVARDLVGQGINVLVQLVAVNGARISLSTNPDLTIDLLDNLRRAGKPAPLCVAVAHPDMPFVSGNAEAPPDMFDLLFAPSASPPLFALPRQPIAVAEYALGMHASALVRDGGCLQIGIGALSDAIVQALLLREHDNERWRGTLAGLDDSGVTQAMAVQWGGLGAFRQGLYGASEMVMDGFMHLQRGGILRRRTYDDIERERRAAQGEIDANPRQGGHYLRGAFVLGSRQLYAWLHESEASDPDAIDMCRVSNVNQLYGNHQDLAALQRRDARFFNTCMMATVFGAVVSDGLESGEVVSGVGGQYNFVAMAHELPGGRSMLLLRATRGSGKHCVSNIRFNYGHTTIPRHLRDVVVTEYGVADLRGKSDSECIQAMLSIADARFIDGLVAQAQAAGKLARGFVVPAGWRRNLPQALAQAMQPLRAAGKAPDFPFGSDFTPIERQLLPALGWLKAASASGKGKFRLAMALFSPGAAVADEDAAIARMGLTAPRGLAERLQARLLRAALRRASTALTVS
jgi:acyl-CoA hydrolase